MPIVLLCLGHFSWPTVRSCCPDSWGYIDLWGQYWSFIKSGTWAGQLHPCLTVWMWCSLFEYIFMVSWINTDLAVCRKPLTYIFWCDSFIWFQVGKNARLELFLSSCWILTGRYGVPQWLKYCIRGFRHLDFFPIQKFITHIPMSISPIHPSIFYCLSGSWSKWHNPAAQRFCKTSPLFYNSAHSSYSMVKIRARLW